MGTWTVVLKAKGLILIAFLGAAVVSAAEVTQSTVEKWYEGVEALPVTKRVLTGAEREALLDKTSRHSVASLKVVGKYDPPPGEIGFCFGRAMAAHLIARKMGLDGDSIRKIFIVGDLRSGDKPEWRFHVTTIVLGEDGKWYAVDPILAEVGFPRPVPAAEWIRVVQRIWDKKKLAKLYLVNRHPVVPDMRIFAATKEDETGERILELSFDPEGKPGFTKLRAPETIIHRIDVIAQERHFIEAVERKPEDGFSWLELPVVVVESGKKTDFVFKFRGYFAELLKDLARPGEPTLLPKEETGNDWARAVGAPDLKGFRVDGALRGGAR